MRVPGPPIAVGNGPGNGALTGSETDERPEAMLLSRRIICILLLPHRAPADAARHRPQTLASPSPRLGRPRRPAPPPPSRCSLAAAGGGDLGRGGRGGRPWKLREASGVVVAESRGEACGENFGNGMGGGGRGGFARCTTRFLGAFFSFVTRALSPPVVGDGCQNGKAERPLHSAPWDFLLSSNRA